MRRRPVDALIDLLAHGCVEAVIALRKAGDPQAALDPRKVRYGDSRHVEFRVWLQRMRPGTDGS